MTDALDLIRPEIRSLGAYAVPDARGLIKLDAMENPYAWPDGMRDEWLAELRDEALNRYPEPAPALLRDALRASVGLGSDTGILLGNGSDELIQMLALALRRDRAVLAPVPTFVMYDLISRIVGLPFVGVPLRPDFGLDREALLTAIRRERPGLVFLAYPNNPTGNLFDEASVLEIIRAAPGWVVVDEAYFPFARRSFIPYLREYPNLLVLRTLSKEGLAGLRLGFLVGPAALIAELDKVRLPYNINRLTQRSVAFALRHSALFAAQAARVVAERERVAQALAARPGLRVFPSDANFILFQAAGADVVWAHLRAARVLIKNMAGSGLPGYLRVTIGTPAENDAFLAALPPGLAGALAHA